MTDEFLRLLQDSWNQQSGLNNLKPSTIENVLKNSRILKNIKRFKKLNEAGEYDIEFLTILLELLIVQEKTNRTDAYMFNNILNSILNEDGIFKIISTTTHNGR